MFHAYQSYWLSMTFHRVKHYSWGDSGLAGKATDFQNQADQLRRKVQQLQTAAMEKTCQHETLQAEHTQRWKAELLMAQKLHIFCKL